MAKVKGPLFSLEADGSVGEVSYRRGQGQSVVTMKPKPRYASTELQTEHRENVQLAWHVLRQVSRLNVGMTGQAINIRTFYTRRAEGAINWGNVLVRRLTERKGAEINAGANAFFRTPESVRVIWLDRARVPQFSDEAIDRFGIGPGAVACIVQRLLWVDGYVPNFNADEPGFFTLSPQG